MIIKKLRKNLTIVGVMHVSPECVFGVPSIILNERPQVVGVELCKRRYIALRSGGAPAPLFPFPFFLYLIQEIVARQIGVKAGTEMVLAIKSAKKIGANVALLDQDIEITLRRLALLPLNEKLRFILWMIGGFLTGQKIRLKSLLDEKKLRWILNQFKTRCPGFYRVLVEERNRVMASNIRRILAKDVKMVCVVGAGHVFDLMDKLSYRG